MDLIFEILTVALLSLALLFNIISVATPGWIYFPPDAYPVAFPDGLAQGLFDGVYGTSSGIVKKSAAEKSAFAFDILAEFALLFAISFCVMTRVGKSRQEKMLDIGKFVLAFVAALFIMIGMSVYTGLHSQGKKDTGASWGYSYAFGWLSFCLSLLGGVVAAYRLEEIRNLIRRKEDDSDH